jgi:hypothetical protein
VFLHFFKRAFDGMIQRRSVKVVPHFLAALQCTRAQTSSGSFIYAGRTDQSQFLRVVPPQFRRVVPSLFTSASAKLRSAQLVQLLFTFLRLLDCFALLRRRTGACGVPSE